VARAVRRTLGDRSAYLELKSSLIGGRMLRARTAADVAQEAYALLTCYQVLRIEGADATAVSGEKTLRTPQSLRSTQLGLINSGTSGLDSTSRAN
jgi:hypothetical protein